MPSNWNQIQLAILTKAFVSIKKMWMSLSAFKSQSVYFIRWTECFAADWNFRFYEEFKDLRKSQNGIYNDSRAVHKTNSDKIIISDILCQHNCQESTRKLQNWNIRQWIDDISQSKQIPQIAEIEFLNFYRLHCFLALMKSICKSFFWLRRNVCFEFVWRYLWLNMKGWEHAERLAIVDCDEVEKKINLLTDEPNVMQRVVWHYKFIPWPSCHRFDSRMTSKAISRLRWQSCRQYRVALIRLTVYNESCKARKLLLFLLADLISLQHCRAVKSLRWKHHHLGKR